MKSHRQQSIVMVPQKKKKNPIIMENPKAPPERSQKDSIFQKFVDLEQEWFTYKHTKPRPHLRRCSTGGFSDSFIPKTSLNSDKLLGNSPRSLMSSLQGDRRRSSPIILDDERFWKVRTNDLAMQEILKERRAALVTGKLKGRRLFGGPEEGDQEICSDCFDFLEESEVWSVESYVTSDDNNDHDHDHDEDKKNFEDCGSRDEKDEASFGSLDGSCLCNEEMVEEEKMEMEMKMNEKARVGGGKLKRVNGGRWMLALAWFAMVTMVFTLRLISIRCNGGNLHEEKVILIPT